MEGLGSLLLFALMFYLMMRFGCGAHMVHGHGGHGSHGSSSEGTSKDPVCGMAVPAGSGYVKMHDGQAVRFCSRQCLDKFEQNPTQFSLRSGVTQ